MKKNLTSILFFLSITLFVVALKVNDFAPVESLEWRLQDWLHTIRTSNAPSDKIALVTIDAKAVDKFGLWPWSRERIADLVAAVGNAGPRSTLVDLDLSDNDVDTWNPGDSIIADQLRWMQNVTVAYEIVPSSLPADTITNPEYLFRSSLRTSSAVGVMDVEAAQPVERVSLPSEPICDASRRLGFSYTTVDKDQMVRWDPLVINYEGYYYPSTTVSAAAEFLGVSRDDIEVEEECGVRIGDHFVPTDHGARMLINFSDADRSYATYSAADVLSEGVDSAQLAGKLVVIALALDNVTGFYNTPVSSEMPQYVKTAMALDNIISGNALRRMDNDPMVYYSILLFIGLVCGIGLPLISPLYRTIVVFFGLVTLASVNFFLFNSMNILANPIYFAIQLVMFLLAIPVLNVRVTLFKKKQPTASEGERPAALQPRAVTDQSDDFGGATQVLGATHAFDDSHALGETQVLGATQALGSTTTRGGTANRGNRPTQPAEIESSTYFDIPLGSESNRSAAYVSDADKSGASTPPESEEQVFGTMAMPQANPSVGASSPTPPAKPAGYNFDEPLEFEKPLPRASAGTVPPTPKANGGADGLLTEADEMERTRLFGSIADAQPVEAMPVVATQPSQEAAKKLGRYQITGVLGKGAMGMVYEGVDPAINRPVALKTIRLDFLSDPTEMNEMKERLFMEAQAAGRLSHPNIVVIYDVGSEGGTQYIAMERLHGRTLEDLIKSKANFNYKIIAKMIVQICHALQYAHDQGIVHRDIKPANIMVLPDYSIKVMDFGIARVESSSMTKTGVAMGTPNYISPEQLQGKTVDGRSDLFSLGVVIYELLVGHRPFKGENLTSLIYAIMNTEPAAPSKANPRVPPLFDHVTLRTLKKDPQQRYQRATDIAQALGDYVGSFVSR